MTEYKLFLVNKFGHILDADTGQIMQSKKNAYQSCLTYEESLFLGKVLVNKYPWSIILIYLEDQEIDRIIYDNNSYNKLVFSFRHDISKYLLVRLLLSCRAKILSSNNSLGVSFSYSGYKFIIKKNNSIWTMYEADDLPTNKNILLKIHELFSPVYDGVCYLNNKDIIKIIIKRFFF